VSPRPSARLGPLKCARLVCMRFLRTPLVALALVLAGCTLTLAQDEQPLAAGSDGVPVPKKKKHVQPVYPPEALAQGIRGIVILDLVIDTEGRVAETHVIRSIPGLDEAALVAARQWRYEPVEVDGRPVSVRLTVPITFALKLPEMTRDRGIPEIRQGVTPQWPRDTQGGGEAVADVTLEPDGRIGLARIIEGGEPWSSALLEALRTWRFRPPPEDVTLSFRVEAEFSPDSGRGGGRVSLHLAGLRETAIFDAPKEEPAEVALLEPPEAPEEPSVVPTEPAGETPSGVPEPANAEPGPEEPPAPTAPQTPTPVQEPMEPTGPADTPEAAPEGLPPNAPAPAATTATPEGEAPRAPATPEAEGGAPTEGEPVAQGAGPAVAAAGSPPPGAVPPVDSTAAPPPVEVLRAVPPPPPPENGISAIRGVVLEPGVPDLTRGRRPVSPPFARMARVEGVVEVDFSVSAGGVTAVQRVDGPELLKPAATQAVESWVFRRTRADRAYLRAVFTYEDDLASAVVRPQPAP
jgi:TonB family protein